MPTMVRHVSKVALFILVMAVSGVGVAQAQTDPDVVPPSPDAVATDGPAAGVITPDVVRQSGRLYATAEQARLATISGGVEYMFVQDMRVSDDKVDSLVTWTFYKINGREDHFFVETVATTSAKDVSTDPFEAYHIFFVEPYLLAETSTARLQDSTPEGTGQWLKAGTPITFALDYQGAEISVTNAPSSVDLTLSPYTSPTWHSVEWLSTDNGNSHPNTNPGAHSFTFVSRWEGGDPWGLHIGVAGSSVSSRTAIVHDWGFCPRVEEGSWNLYSSCLRRQSG